jgi:hypothetical protein
MKSQPENMIDPGTHQDKSKRGKPDRRWTLLFIGDHGRVITLKRFKGIVILTGVAFILSLATIAVLLWYTRGVADKNEKMESSLDIFQKRIQTLRHEKEILMARLVLAESRAKERNDDSRSIDAPKPWLANNQEEPTQENPKKVVAKQGTTPAPAATPNATASAKPRAEAEPPQTNLSVNVGNFNIVRVSDPNKIKIQFKIKNTSPNSQRVAGHAIVILKGDNLQPKMWLSVPPMGLVGGKPTGKQRGHGFSINYFRTMRFTTNIPQSPDRFNKAAVYVYTREGQLLLEQEFPADIPAPKPVPKPKVSKTPSTGSAAPVQPIGDPKQKTENSQGQDQTSETKDRSPLY